MTKADGYRRQAEFCDQQAKQHGDAQVRQQFLLLARQWRDLADHAFVVERAEANAMRSGAGHGARVH